MALYLIVVQAHFIMNNVFEGMIWFFLPVSLVICNDIFAYICGITFGRTQLIKLSPKKTVEGFVGAWFLTVIFGVLMTNVLMRYNYFICPVNVRNPVFFITHVLILPGSRSNSLYRTAMHTKPSLPATHIPPPNLVPFCQHLFNGANADSHLSLCNLRLSHRSIRRILRLRSQAHFQDQGLW